jgi:hypothetical protein
MRRTLKHSHLVAFWAGLPALVSVACGGLAGVMGGGGDDDDDSACPKETPGWHEIKPQRLPNNATGGWFAVSTGDGVLSLSVLDDGVRAVLFNLATARLAVSEFTELGHLPPTGVLPEYAWTGSSLLVFGTFVHGDERRPPRGLVYEPSDDRWTPMSTEGQPASAGCSAWTGTEFLVFVPDWNGPLKAHAYDPVADRWQEREPLTAPASVLVGCQAVRAKDNTVIVWAYADEEMPDVPASFDPEANQWRLLAKDPVVPRRYESQLAYSDGVVLFWGGKDPDPPDPSVLYVEVPPRRYMVDTDTWLGVSVEGLRTTGSAANIAAVPGGIVLQGEHASAGGPNDFGFFYAPKEDRWFALQHGCAERGNFFGFLVWTDYGPVLWRGWNDNSAPIAWRYEGPLR